MEALLFTRVPNIMSRPGMKMGTFQMQEQVNGQIAKRKRQSPSKDCNYPGKSFLGFYFCILHFAFCVLTCSCLHREEQVKGQSAKRKRQSHGADYNDPSKA
jgi:hypothetical protein